MKITELPSDIRLIVLSHLDLPSLFETIQSHTSFNSVWRDYPEHLSRAICIRTGLADSKTLGAAAPLRKGDWFRRGGVDEELSEEELRDVIEEQRSMSDAFDGVKTWTEYGE
jgi:hypothetical protein